MGYTVRRDQHIEGHYDTKEEAYERIVELCGREKPRFLYTTRTGIDYYTDAQGTLIFIVPDPT